MSLVKVKHYLNSLNDIERQLLDQKANNSTPQLSGWGHLLTKKRMSAKHQTPAAFDDDEIKSIWSQQATAELQDSEPTRSWAAVDEKQKKAAKSPGWGNRMLPLHHPLLDGAEWSVWQTGSECGTLIRSLTGGSWQLLQLTTECQTPCKNKASLSKERMNSLPAQTANHSSSLRALSVSCSNHGFHQPWLAAVCEEVTDDWLILASSMADVRPGGMLPTPSHERASHVRMHTRTHTERESYKSYQLSRTVQVLIIQSTSFTLPACVHFGKDSNMWSVPSVGVDS